MLKSLRSGKSKLVIISNNCPPLRKSEIEYYAMLAKTGVHHYSGSAYLHLFPSARSRTTRRARCTSDACETRPQTTVAARAVPGSRRGGVLHARVEIFRVSFSLETACERWYLYQNFETHLPHDPFLMFRKPQTTSISGLPAVGTTAYRACPSPTPATPTSSRLCPRHSFVF